MLVDMSVKTKNGNRNWQIQEKIASTVFHLEWLRPCSDLHNSLFVACTVEEGIKSKLAWVVKFDLELRSLS